MGTWNLPNSKKLIEDLVFILGPPNHPAKEVEPIGSSAYPLQPDREELQSPISKPEEQRAKVSEPEFTEPPPPPEVRPTEPEPIKPITPELKPVEPESTEAKPTEPPPAEAARGKPEPVAPKPVEPRKSSLTWLLTLVGFLVVLGVAGGIWWRWSQPAVSPPKAPAPPTASLPQPPNDKVPALPGLLAKPQEMLKRTKIRGVIGVQLQNVTPELAKAFGMFEAKGALGAEVHPGMPAAKAGIERGDIIIDFNGHPIHEMNELPRMVADTMPGSKATLKVLRQGKEKTISLTIAELTEEKPAQAKEEGAGEKTLLGL